MGDSLRNLCRLCGGERALEEGRAPHHKEEHAGLISRAVNIDIASDDDRIHPPFICHNCIKTLKYWWQKQYKKGIPCSIKVFDFQTPGCSLCHRSSVSFEDIARQHGMCIWNGKTFTQAMILTENGMLMITLQLFFDSTWKATIGSGEVVKDNPFFKDIPSSVKEPADIVKLIHVIVHNNVCVGNEDFKGIVLAKTGLQGEIPVTITGNDKYELYPSSTIRHQQCTLLVAKPSKRCPPCKLHRGDLFSIDNRLKKQQQRSGPGSSTRNDRLTQAQLIKKTKTLATEKRQLTKRISHLRNKISTLICEDGVSLPDEQEKSLVAAMNANEASFKQAVGEGSPALLLWEQQQESAVKGKGMRWHPAILRLCIAMHSKSAAAYSLLRESGFARLPHPNTLHPYAHFGNPSTGINADLVKRLVDDIKLPSLPEHQRNIIISFDEMKIKSGLVYNSRTGLLAGFIDVGSLGNEILAFERRCRGEVEAPLATHVLVLMARGIFSSLHSPIGFYATCGASSHQLYPIIHEAVVFMESIGFKVRGLVCDGASPNRKFYKLLGEPGEQGVKHFAANPVDRSRKIFFLCDVPHLLKTTRNNWENSGWNNKTRNLHFRKQDITWNQLVDLYNWDIGKEKTSPGLRRLHRLGPEHLYLTPSSRMRVYMAAQVLSTTVANVFKARGRHDTKSTEFFISQFDQFFDCLNVSSPQESTRKRKPALAPYTSPDDWRFKLLLQDFLGFLDEWEKEAESLHDVDKAVRRKMCLSRETLEGLRITVHSFVQLGQTLLKEDGVQYLLSEKLNQDPLEQYFSKQRGTGGASDNPTSEQFAHNMFALYAASSSVKASKKGNTRTKQLSEIDSTPLPKRAKIK